MNTKTRATVKAAGMKATPEDIEVLRTLTDDEALIRWAQTVDRSTVQEFIKNLHATGGGQARVEARKKAAAGLQGRDLEELQKAMGTYDPGTPDGPYETDDGRRLVFPASMTAETRARLARQQMDKNLERPTLGLNPSGAFVQPSSMAPDKAMGLAHKQWEQEASRRFARPGR